MTNFANIFRAILQFEPDREDALQQVLDNIQVRFRADTVTIHRLEPGRQVLTLVAQRGLPPQLLPVVREIPLGKGIAGEAAQTGKPVTICNLQTDSSGVSKPAAKQTGVGGALCVPLFAEDDTIVGTIGVGTRAERTFTEDDTQDLVSAGRVIADFLDALPVAGQ